MTGANGEVRSRRERSRPLVLAVLVVSASAAAPQARAQPPDLSGPWEVTWANAIRTERDGSITVQSTTSAELTLRQEGEEIEGRWAFRTRAGHPVAWRIRGVLHGNRLRLETTERLTPPLPDEGGGALTGMEWTGTLESGRLEGEMWMNADIGGQPRRSGPRPWSARRGG